MNAASGNGAKPNPNIHPSQGNTNIPTNPGNGLPNTATTPGNITTPGNNPGNPATALNPGNQLANPNPSQNSLQNVKRTIYSQNNLGKPFHDATVQEMDAKGAHITDKHINVDDTYIQARANPPDGHRSPDNASRFFGGAPGEEAIYGKDFAQGIIQNALREKEDFIVRNMQRGRRIITIEYSPNKGPIGRGVSASGTYVEDMHDVKIIIVKGNEDGIYRIITAYPIKRKNNFNK